MAVKRFIPIKGLKAHLALRVEIKFLKKHYPFLKIRTENGVLFCQGYCQPSEHSPIYFYRIEWEPGKYPKIYPIPEILYNDDIHLYKDGSLCLFYPKDFSYGAHTKLYESIIPWTHEWFLFYELYLIKGKWLHPYVEHRKI